MKILVSGCSFTHWPAEPGSQKNICWPSYLGDHDITNLAEPGAGNHYIANSIIRALCDRPDYYDMVLVMWSGVSRLDFLTDISNPDWHRLFDAYGFYRRIESCPNDLGYIFSGGFMGPWYLDPAAGSVFRQLYKVSNDLSLAHHNVMEIVKCQEFLKSRNQPYRFMSYVNYWRSGKGLSPNGDFGLTDFNALKPLVDSIDFKQWIFADNERNGIYEMAKEAKDYHGDKFHPGPTTHQHWAGLVMRSIAA